MFTNNRPLPERPVSKLLILTSAFALICGAALPTATFAKGLPTGNPSECRKAGKDQQDVRKAGRDQQDVRKAGGKDIQSKKTAEEAHRTDATNSDGVAQFFNQFLNRPEENDGLVIGAKGTVLGTKDGVDPAGKGREVREGFDGYADLLNRPVCEEGSIAMPFKPATVGTKDGIDASGNGREVEADGDGVADLLTGLLNRDPKVVPNKPVATNVEDNTIPIAEDNERTGRDEKAIAEVFKNDLDDIDIDIIGDKGSDLDRNQFGDAKIPSSLDLTVNASDKLNRTMVQIPQINVHTDPRPGVVPAPAPVLTPVVTVPTRPVIVSPRS
jgi:hypothetical protein